MSNQSYYGSLYLQAPRLSMSDDSSGGDSSMDSSNMSLDVCPTSFYTDFVAPEEEHLTLAERDEGKSLEGYLALQLELKRQTSLDQQSRQYSDDLTEDFPEFFRPSAPVRKKNRNRFEEFRAGKLRRSQTVPSKPKARKPKASLEGILEERSMSTIDNVEYRYSGEKAVAPLRKKKAPVKTTSKPKARTVKSPKGGRPALKAPVPRQTKSKVTSRSKLSNPTRVTKPRMSERMTTTMMTKTSKTRSKLTSPIRATKKKLQKRTGKTPSKAMRPRGKLSKGKGKMREPSVIMI